MGALIADLFKEHRGIAEFRESIVGLGGRFAFEPGDMLELGAVYFERYPDCFSNRNCQEVQLGYQMVRICVVEKAIADLPEPSRQAYRTMFFSIRDIDARVDSIVAARGADAALEELAQVERGVASLKDAIDTLPTGMIKERFVGGISNIFNVVYLIKTSLARHR
ncbi:MAG TPA: hypothetical protein PKM65_14245 [Spirochaetota bacterium]|nr:hypothetical protein [Spirochaetota bacterium]HNT12909.1 hypothetical protein [Spirochaetota bacterium]HNV47414.1 hypothetical protein [Spirochaetota bacterium]HOS39299.1 hypothetical protein [Spirochaetota bacterium]HPI22285.1 hypothetical protein [Spirochaetota bacterium]